MSKFNERLRILRDEAGLKSAELAEALCIAPSTMSLYLKDREPGYDMLMKIASYFKVTTDWLIGYTEFRTRPTIDLTLDPERILKALASVSVNEVDPSSEKYDSRYDVSTAKLSDSLFPATVESSIVNYSRVYAMITATADAYHKTVESFMKKKAVKWDVFLQIFDRCMRLMDLHTDLMHYYTYEMAFTLTIPLDDQGVVDAFLNHEKGIYSRRHPERNVIAEYKELVENK